VVLVTDRFTPAPMQTGSRLHHDTSERVIASADGIDYMESSSAQGLSTITVHLKLNYDTNGSVDTDPSETGAGAQ